MSDANRRSFVRATNAENCLLHVKDSEVSSAGEFCSVMDSSAGGVAVISQQIVVEHQPVSVRFNGGESLGDEKTGKVVHTERLEAGGYVIGIQFIEEDEEG